MTGAPASPRIRAFLDALPLACGLRILEIGCGPGAAAREILRRRSGAFVLGIDRSAAAIRQARGASAAEMAAGLLDFRCVDVADFRLEPGEAPFDQAFAMRVGALDGRHPQREAAARACIRAALNPGGLLWLDTGDPARAVAP